MKKLYASLALVAATALSMGAQSLLTSIPFPEGQLRQVKAREVSTLNFDIPHLTTTVANGSQARVASRVEGLGESYICYQTNFFAQALTNEFVTIKAEADGSYALPGLLGWEDGKWIEAIKYNSDIKATVNANGDIEIPLGQLLAKYELTATTTYDILLYSIDADGHCLDEGTYVLKQNGATYENSEMGLGVGFVTDKGISMIEAVADLKFAEPNFNVSYIHRSVKDVETEYNIPAYVEIVEDGGYKTLSTSGFFFLMGSAVPMAMDMEADFAYAQTPMVCLGDDEELGAYYYRPVFQDPEDATKGQIGWNLEIRANLEYDGNGELTKVSMPMNFDDYKFISLYMATDPNADGQYSWCGQLKNVVMTRTNAGVEAVLGDNNDENAPVEYFNLQGMKVNNPAAGQLVIRRQGNKVNKMIIR